MKKLELAARWLLPLAVLVVTGGLYISTLAPGMLRGDSGEFQWAMASLNVAHATGYPLFTLLGHAWYQLPIPYDPAWRLNLLSAIFGAGASAVLFVLARSLTGRNLPALAATGFFSLAPVIWFNASILEVYSLNALFLGLLLYLLWRWYRNYGSDDGHKSDTPLYLAALLFGLSLAHHRMTVLLVPAIVVFLLAVDRRFFSNIRRLVTLAALTLPGLFLYLYVPLQLIPEGATTRFWFLDIILGQEYASSLRLYPDPLMVVALIPWQNLHVGLALAAAGLPALWFKYRPFSLLLVLTIGADVLFALFYTVPDVQVFLTPALLVLALWTAAGTDWLAGLAFRLPPFLARPVHFALLLAALLLSALSLARYPEIQSLVASEAGGKETRAREILSAGLPKGAVLELDWETATAIRFLQTVERLRPDLEARLIHMDRPDEYYRVLRDADADRPVYVESGIKWVRAAAGYRTTPAPLELVQILPSPYAPQMLGRAISPDLQLSGYSLAGSSLQVYWKSSKPLLRDYATYIHFFDEAGQPAGQEDHGACCEAIYGFRTSEWDPGQMISETFQTPPEGAAYMEVGVYALKGDEIESYGSSAHIQIKPVRLPLDAQPLGIVLTPNVTAQSYSLASDAAGTTLAVYWQSNGASGRNLTVFVHLLDASGQIISTADRRPLDGVYPTDSWQSGEIVADRYALPPDPRGRQIEFGMYDSASGARLHRADGKGDTIVVPLK